jgi:hypothetical protein
MGRALVHVFESLSDGIVIFDESLRIITCNVACVTMLGFANPLELLSEFSHFDALLRPIGELVSPNKTASDSDSSKSDNHSSLTDWLSDLKALVLSAKFSRQVRFEAMLKKNPSLFKANGNGHPASDRDYPPSSEAPKVIQDDQLYCSADLSVTSFSYKKETFFSAVLRDVTQDKLYREKDTLLAFLSHEIRNPVQAITLGCHLLLQKSKNRSISSIAKDLYLAADLLHSVVTDTIDYVQISTHNFHPKMEVFFSLLDIS